MSISILEALMNADANMENNHPFTIHLARKQLHNAVGLLVKDYPLDTQVEPLLERYGDVESVPRCEDMEGNNE